jgi:hypothetical protein
MLYHKSNAKKQLHAPSSEVAPIINFDFISGILLSLSAIFFIILVPFFAPIIRGIASDIGYGSAKRFYFIIQNFELISILIRIFFLINAMLLFIAGYGFLKLKFWARTIHVIVWCMILIIFPIGTLSSFFALRLVYRKKY